MSLSTDIYLTALLDTEKDLESFKDCLRSYYGVRLAQYGSVCPAFVESLVEFYIKKNKIITFKR